jgi:hypothetical protein
MAPATLGYGDVDRPARPDDGNPARLIAVMVGIVGILLLGSLAWSAVGALFAALGEATAVLAPPTPVRLAANALTPTVRPPTPGATAVTTVAGTPTPGPPAPTRTVPPAATSGPTANAAATGVATSGTPVAGTPTPAADGRAPWILLPQPAPGTRVAPGQMVIEARGRGDAAITAIRLELDGAPLSVALEQRSESTWRGFANARITPGQHNVRATVIDEAGRTGGYRWSFDAGP